MDAVCDPLIHTVVVMSSAQVGKTEIVNNIVGYYIHQDPSPILVLRPTLEMTQAWSKDRLAPMLRDTPVLRNKVKNPRARDSGNTLQHKTFPGGHITMCGANSPASLASRPIRIVLCDEVDRYPVSAGSEGHPVNLARKRSATFWNRKLLLSSTPTTAGASRIEAAFQESDQRRFYVPCPDCNAMEPLQWSQIEFTDRDPLTTCWTCEHCGGIATEADKARMLRGGEWRAGSVFNGVAGFHITELASPWRKWSEVVEDFLQAKAAQERGSIELMQVWVNTSLGEIWTVEGETVDENLLYRRREHYESPAPHGVQIITAFADLQADRIECEVCGCGYGDESWSLDFWRLYGDPTKPQLWEVFAGKLKTRYAIPDGTLLDIRIAGVDSGYLPDEVYWFSHRMGVRFVIPTKGRVERNHPVATFPRKMDPKRKAYLTMLSTDTAKEIIYRRYLISEPGPGHCHFPVRDAYNQDYFEQATAEKKILRYSRGVAYYEWNAEKRRNEALDCKVGNLAMIRVLQQHGGVVLHPLPGETDDDGETVDQAAPPPRPPPSPRRKQPPRGPSRFARSGL